MGGRAHLRLAVTRSKAGQGFREPHRKRRRIPLCRDDQAHDTPYRKGLHLNEPFSDGLSRTIIKTLLNCSSNLSPFEVAGPGWRSCQRRGGARDHWFRRTNGDGAALFSDTGLVPIRTRWCRSRFYHTKEICKISGTNGQNLVA